MCVCDDWPTDDHHSWPHGVWWCGCEIVLVASPRCMSFLWCGCVSLLWTCVRRGGWENGRAVHVVCVCLCVCVCVCVCLCVCMWHVL